MPPDEGFYDLFNQAAGNVAESARLLRDLLSNVGDVGLKEQLVACERRGDDLLEAIRGRLRRTIVPPFDAEDIQALADHVDDVVDEIEATGERLALHHVTEPLPEMLELADLLVKSADATVALLAKVAQPRTLAPELEVVDRLESEADRVYRRSVARLFSGELAAFEVLRLKDVVEGIEASINKIEKLSDVVEAIAVKHT
jgi:predicted phosphate transport protein (TIGR00153 family)